MNTQVEGIVTALRFAHRRFSYGLEQVPEERLNWSPGGKAHTPLVIGGRVARFIGTIGAAIQAREMPAPPAGGLPPGPETRAAAIDAIDGAFDRLLSAIDGLTEADLTLTMRSPTGRDMTIAGWLAFSNQVIGYLQGQLNLVQLAYGDEDSNIPPAEG